MARLLFLDHPCPRTTAATVTAARAGGFELDRCLFHPGKSEWGHPQPPDRGTVWLGGDKRRLQAVGWRRGALVHRLEGAVPRVGDEVRCHLDVSRREDVEAAHAAMHLVLSALAHAGRIVARPPARVVGGRRFRVTVDRAGFDPARIADALSRAQEAVTKNRPVTVDHAIGPAARTDLPPTWTEWPRPGPQAAARIVRVGDASAWACDGTLPRAVGGLGRIVLEGHRGRGAVHELRFWARP